MNTAHTIAFWLVFLTGCGGVLWLGLYLWCQTLDYLFTVLKVKTAIIGWYRNRKEFREWESSRTKSSKND